MKGHLLRLRGGDGRTSWSHPSAWPSDDRRMCPPGPGLTGDTGRRRCRGRKKQTFVTEDRDEHFSQKKNGKREKKKKKRKNKKKTKKNNKQTEKVSKVKNMPETSSCINAANAELGSISISLPRLFSTGPNQPWWSSNTSPTLSSSHL